MIQRGDDVDLHPEIQAACVPDIAKFCLTTVKHGQVLDMYYAVNNCWIKLLLFIEILHW